MAPFLYGLQRDLLARAYYGPVAAVAWSWPWYALATVALIPLLLLALHRIRQAHRMVTLHKHGIIIRWTRGRKHKLYWEEIDSLICNTVNHTFLGTPPKTRHLLTIHYRSGKPIRIDDRIPELPELTARIKAKVYPRLLPQLRAAFQTGDPLYFGPVTFHKEFVKIREREILWEQVARMNVIAGNLMVESKSNQTYKVAVGKIPNADLLIQLLQEGVHQ